MTSNLLLRTLFLIFWITATLPFNIQSQTCTPTFVCSSSWYISNVNFAGINNASTCINNAYGNYTATVAPGNVTGGTAVPISVQVGPGGPNYLAVWIDYDHSLTFDSSEYKYIGSGNNSAINGSVFIPSRALGGTTRMRLRLRRAATYGPTEACLADGYTETEDYSINITPAKIVILYAPFKDTLYDPTVTIVARIKQLDVGLNTVDSLKPRIWAKRTGGGAWKSFKGTLESGNANDGSWNFVVNHDSLSIRRNSCDSIVYYFVAQDMHDTINLSYLPEPGALHTSVAVQFTPAPVPFGYRLKPRLKDTIYVSQNDCRYTSLSSENMLFDQINQRGLEGNLTVIINDDIYERGTNALTGSGLNGHSLTIRPDSNIVRRIYSTIDGNGQGNISAIKLNGVTNVIIDGSFNGLGRYLNFINTSGTYYRPDTVSNIKLFNSCHQVIIRNILFQQNRYSQIPGEASIFVAQGTNTNIFLLNNKFSSITAAAMANRHIVSVFGNNTITIRGNEFDNFRESAIRIFDSCSNWLIDSNHFYRTVVPSDYSYDWAAITVTGGGHRITNNYIGGKAPFCAGGNMTFVDNPVSLLAPVKALAPGGSNPVTISGNRIDNIKATNTYASAAGQFSGIYCNNNYCIIDNNIIGNPQSSTPTISIFGNTINGITSIGDKPVVITNNQISGLTTLDNVSGFQLAINMYGIFRSNNANGLYLFNQPATITGNKITNLVNLRNAAAYDQYEDLGGTAGISVNGGTLNIIELNDIHGISVAGAVVGGIVFTGGYGQPSVIRRNRIFDLSNISYGTISGIGINSDTAGVNIINNQIMINNRNLSSNISIKGIFENYHSGVFPRQRILYNTVYIGGTASAGSNSGSAAFYSRYLPVKDIYNNIFYNERAGGTVGHYAYKFDGDYVEHFNYSKAGNNLFVVNDTAFFAQSSPVTHRGWRSWKAFTMNDSSSYVTLPFHMPANQFFINKDSGNLNVNPLNDISWYANGKALPVAGIGSDFDSSNIRSVSVATGATDIGADEFNTNTVPPSLSVYGRHAPGGADTLSFNDRIMGIISWGNTGTLPTLGNCSWYSGTWPNDPTNNGTVSDARYMNGYWVLPATGGNGYTYNLTLFYDAAMLGKIISGSSMVINKKQIGVPGTWNLIVPTVLNNNTQTLTVNNQTSFSEFTATDMLAPLPLGLFVFNGKKSGANIQLNWAVENASDNQSYEIEKSTDGKSFYNIEKVVGGDNKAFQYTDYSAFNTGISLYYRLKIIKRSGDFFYSSMLYFKIKSDEPGLKISSVYPNPFSEKLVITITALVAETIQIRIINIEGKIMYKFAAHILSGSNTIDVNQCSGLSKGNYFLEIIGTGKTKRYKVLKN